MYTLYTTLYYIPHVLFLVAYTTVCTIYHMYYIPHVLYTTLYYIPHVLYTTCICIVLYAIVTLHSNMHTHYMYYIPQCALYTTVYYIHMYYIPHVLYTTVLQLYTQCSVYTHSVLCTTLLYNSVAVYTLHSNSVIHTTHVLHYHSNSVAVYYIPQ